MKSHCQPARLAWYVSGRGVIGLTTHHSVHLKDSEGDQSCKRRGKNVPCIQDRDASRKFFTSVESRKDVQCTRIIWRLSNAQEEPREQQTGIVTTQRRQATDNGPHRHT